MDNLALEKDIHSAGLIILGELQVTDNDPVPKEAQSILLLGPDEPNFWEIFKESEEFNDLDADPLDRWSKRVIDNIAVQNDCTALYLLVQKHISRFFLGHLDLAQSGHHRCTWPFTKIEAFLFRFEAL